MFVGGRELIGSLRWFNTGRFATTIFCATKRCNVGTMLQPFKRMLQQLMSQRCVVLKSSRVANITFKQRRRGRLQKRYLKGNVVLLQNLSRLFHFVQFFKCWHFFWSWILKGWNRSSGKEKETVAFCSRHPKNVKFDIFMS